MPLLDCHLTVSIGNERSHKWSPSGATGVARSDQDSNCDDDRGEKRNDDSFSADRENYRARQDPVITSIHLVIKRNLLIEISPFLFRFSLIFWFLPDYWSCVGIVSIAACKIKTIRCRSLVFFLLVDLVSVHMICTLPTTHGVYRRLT